MLTLVRADDSMTSIARRLGMLRSAPSRRNSLSLENEFDSLEDSQKEAVEAEFSRRLARGTAEQMHFYPILAAEFLGGAYAA